MIQIIKAIIKFFMRLFSNRCYHKEKREAQSSAYKKTGRKIKNARKNGYFIDGSSEYNKQLEKSMEKVKENKELRDKFIDDL